MTEDFYFLDEARVNVTAASIGVSHERWICVEEVCSMPDAKEIMESFRFDQLPIVSPNGFVSNFYSVLSPNDYSSIKKSTIEFDDVLPVSTSLPLLIEKFITSGKHCFFLAMHNRIVGLVSIGNLNCKQAQVYLFDLICELERELAEFLNTYKKSEIRDWVESKLPTPKDPKNKFVEMLAEFDQLVTEGFENQLTEHFYLVDLFSCIRYYGLHTKLGYSGSKWDKLCSINEIRNKVAHPNRSLITSIEEFEQLHSRLKRINELLFRLRRHKQGYQP